MVKRGPPGTLTVVIFLQPFTQPGGVSFEYSALDYNSTVVQPRKVNAPIVCLCFIFVSSLERVGGQFGYSLLSI